MNNFENPQEQPEAHLRSEKIQTLIERLRRDEGKTFKLTENDTEYILVTTKGGAETTDIITKSGDEDADAGAIYSEIMRPLAKEDYLGAEQLGHREDI